ncbi:MAG: DUF2007 domain-containing protein [Hyphomicrobiaceae bacterium]
MREILRSTDPVAVNFAESLLKEAGIAHFVADRHMSGAEGGINAFPHRLLVAAGDWGEARQLLFDAGLGAELTPAAVGSPGSGAASQLPRGKPE